MKKFTTKALAISLAAAGIFALNAGAATADDGHYHGRYHHSDRFHDELEHRAYHRELAHREAHRYPMTRYEHARLHDALDHEAYHDHLADRAYHRRPQYTLRHHYGLPGHSAYNYHRPVGTSFGFVGARSGVSFYYGR
jgi:hypothetical protein